MTAKEKAKQLVSKFTSSTMRIVADYEWVEDTDSAKQCAIISVNEIIEGIERAFDEYEKATGVYVKNRIFYWDFYSDVKSEIYKL
jgi:hypothetical protein